MLFTLLKISEGPGVPSQSPEPCWGLGTEADRAWERLLMDSVKLTAKQVNRKPRGQIQGVGANGTGQ